MKKFLAILFIGCAVVAGVGAQDDVPASIEVIGGDEEALREFIGRFLRPIYGQPNEGVNHAILIGELPEELPVDVPLIEDAQVIGSMVQEEPFDAQIILETSQSLDEVFDFYDSSLTEAGWHEINQTYQSSGFVPPSPERTQLNFCDDANNYVSVIAIPLTEDSLDVRLQVQTPMRYNQCSAIVGGGMQTSGVIPAPNRQQASPFKAAALAAAAMGSKVFRLHFLLI